MILYKFEYVNSTKYSVYERGQTFGCVNLIDKRVTEVLAKIRIKAPPQCRGRLPFGPVFHGGLPHDSLVPLFIENCTPTSKDGFPKCCYRSLKIMPRNTYMAEPRLKVGE